MARWMTGHTAAAMSTRKPDNGGRPSRPWKHHRSNDLSMWLICGCIIIGSALVWYISNETEVQKRALDPNEDDQTALAASDNDEEGGAREESLIANEAKLQDKERDEPSLLWWIESAPLPDLQALASCLDQPNLPPPQLMTQAQGFSILISGRHQPQTIYEREEKVWVKTPLLSSPHQQSYDHLSLISCLQTPGASLYDPLLVRQWGGADWPSRGSKTGGVMLEDLFIIRSEGASYHTYGLHRLGLPELGLMTSSEEGRSYLQRFTLHWILQPQSRAILQETEVDFKIRGQDLKVIKGDLIDEWIGDPNVKLIVNSENESLSTKNLGVLFKISKKQEKSLKSRRSIRQKRKKKRKQKRKQKQKQKRKQKRKQKPKALPSLKYR